MLEMAYYVEFLYEETIRNYTRANESLKEYPVIMVKVRKKLVKR